MDSLPRRSCVPDVIAALVTAFGAIPGVMVLDGPLNTYPTGDVLLVGTDIGPDVSVQLANDTRPGIPAYEEDVDVICAVWSWNGNREYATKRSRCADILLAVRQILAADPTLGNVCDNVTLGSTQEWIQAVSNGYSCTVGFAIHATRTI